MGLEDFLSHPLRRGLHVRQQLRLEQLVDQVLLENLLYYFPILFLLSETLLFTAYHDPRQSAALPGIFNVCVTSIRSPYHGRKGNEKIKSSWNVTLYFKGAVICEYAVIFPVLHAALHIYTSAVQLQDTESCSNTFKLPIIHSRQTRRSS